MYVNSPATGVRPLSSHRYSVGACSSRPLSPPCYPPTASMEETGERSERETPPLQTDPKWYVQPDAPFGYWSLSGCSIQDALSAFSQPNNNGDARLEFYAIYQKVATKYDADYVKARHVDLNVILIVVCSIYLLSVPHLTRSQAGLLSAVTTSFIVDITLKIEPDPSKDLAALLNATLLTLNRTAEDPTPPGLRGPWAAILFAHVFMYVTLCISLFTTFLAMTEKRRLSWYSSSMGGPMIERCRDRQRNFDGHAHFRSFNLAQPPLMVLTSLLTVACGFCARLIYTSSISGLSFLAAPLGAILFYNGVVSPTHLSAPQPQPPVFTSPRRQGSRKGALYRTWDFVLCQVNRVLLWFASAKTVRHNQALQTVQPTSQALPLSTVRGPVTSPLWLTRTDLAALQEANIDDAKCVSWLLLHITDPEALNAAIRFATVIRWYEDGINVEGLYKLIISNLEECFGSDGTICPRLRDRAYYSVQAITWMRTCGARVSKESAVRFLHPTIPHDTTRLDQSLRHFLKIYFTQDANERLIQMYRVGLGVAPADIQLTSNMLLHVSWHFRNGPRAFNSITKVNAWGDWSTIPFNAMLNRLLTWCIFLGWRVDKDALRVQDKSCVTSYFQPTCFSCCCCQSSHRTDRFPIVPGNHISNPHLSPSMRSHPAHAD